MRIDTSIEIAKKDFVVMADSTIDIKVDLNFRLNIVKESSINLIESVTESEKKDRESFIMQELGIHCGKLQRNLAVRLMKL